MLIYVFTGPKTKNPQSRKTTGPEDFTLFHQSKGNTPYPLFPEDWSLYVYQAGLLAPGSSYLPSLPGILTPVANFRLSSPDTAAGPPLILTGFPLGLTSFIQS